MANTDVSDELKRSGISFGKLVETTGKAVGETQLKLNQTGAATASTLATTQVDVIAVQESEYDDQGNLVEARSHTRKLPLINFIDPVFYEWSEVRLRGEFHASEFAASGTQSSSSFSSKENYVSTGLAFVLGPGGMSSSYGSSSQNTSTNASSDVSWGRIRTSALLTPKRDVGVPKPRSILRGPSLGVIAGETKDVTSGEETTGRTLAVMIELRRNDGTPIAGKSISIETEGVAWAFAVQGQDKTDANGQVAIVLSRQFLTPDADRSPVGVVVTARLGLVANSTTLTF